MRAWILGNGPSLRKNPLDKLAGEVTFATGRINLLFRETTWRPVYYVLAEGPETNVHVEPRLRSDLRVIVKEVKGCYFQKGLQGITYALPHTSDIEYFYTCQHATGEPPETWHLPEICHYGSSVHVAMQIATLKGFSPLYLLGCDLTGGHFTKDYGDSLVQTELWRKAHEVASRSGVEVYNATPGGELEVYPRVNLEDILCQ